MSKKKFDPKYIEDANKRLWQILNDKKEFDDWTQIALSVQNAVQAAANIWGTSSDEQIHNMAGFIRELAFAELSNLTRFNIVFADKNSDLTLKSVEWRYEHDCNNLRTMLKHVVKDNGGEIKLTGLVIDTFCEIDDDGIKTEDVDRWEITRLYINNKKLYADYRDIRFASDFDTAEIEEFSYDDLNSILCHICRTLKL